MLHAFITLNVFILHTVSPLSKIDANFVEIDKKNLHLRVHARSPLRIVGITRPRLRILLQNELRHAPRVRKIGKKEKETRENIEDEGGKGKTRVNSTGRFRIVPDGWTKPPGSRTSAASFAQASARVKSDEQTEQV